MYVSAQAYYFFRITQITHQIGLCKRNSIINPLEESRGSHEGRGGQLGRGSEMRPGRGTTEHSLSALPTTYLVFRVILNLNS